MHALSLARPQDCAHFASTSRSTNSLCSTDILWRNLHSTLLDSPQLLHTSSSDQPHRELCKRYIEATTLLEQSQSSDTPPPPDKLLPLLETLVHLAQTRPLAGIDSLNQSFLEKYLSPNTSNILKLHPTFSNPPKLRSQKARDQSSESVRISELFSQLHSLSTPSLLSTSSSLRTAAREIVYERLNFTRSSSYGPLSSNSNQIDYRKVSAISLLMSANLEDAKSLGWGQESPEDPTVPPTGWESTRIHSARTGPEVKIDERDWAGVTTHEWRGTYSFLHYPVYHHFNHHRNGGFIPSLSEENEAVGDCMSLKLELVPEGEELTPPMVAFGERGTERVQGDAGRRADTSDDEDDDDFDNDLEVVTDEDDSSTSSDEEEDGFNTHYVTNNSTRRASSNSQDPAASPPTSPLSPSSFPAAPLGPLPPCTTPSTSTSSNSVYPKLSFRGTSLPLQLRTLSFTGTFLNSQSQSHFNPRDRSIRGTVEMNDAAEVVWKYIIRYGGRDQWAM